MSSRRVVTLGCLALTAAMGLAPTPSLAAPAFHRVRGKAIATLLTGREFSDEVHFTMLFEKGGALRMFSTGRRREGAWRVEDDQLCLDRTGDDHQCFEVWTSGSRLELRREAGPPEEGILRRPKVL